MGSQWGTCKDCKSTDFGMVVVKNSIWRKICDSTKDILCLNCMEKRLNRPLRFSDLKETGILNDALLYMKIALNEKKISVNDTHFLMDILDSR